MEKKVTVILDAGHGSNTPGKRSPDNKIFEYAYCRKLVQAIADKIKDFANPIILVPEETDTSLTERVKRANNYYTKANKRAFLVSIHLNAAGSGNWCNASGWSVFVSKNASDKSKKLAKIMTDNAIANKITGNRSVPAEKYWTWSWTSNDIYILKSSNCPAVLTENMFMDNKQDVEFLLSEKGFNTLIQLHTESIKQFILNNY